MTRREVGARRQPGAARGRWLGASLAACLLVAGCTGDTGRPGIPSPGSDSPGVVAWGGYTASQMAVPEAALSAVQAVAAGDAYNVALKADGTVVAWGADAEGRWEELLTAASLAATAGSRLTAISAGDHEALALTDAGQVLAWAPRAELRTDAGRTPVPDRARSGITAISAGGWAHLAVDSAGGVIAWGGEGSGLPGASTTVPPEASSGIRAVASGAGHHLALTTSGKVLAWPDDLEQTAVPPEARDGVAAIAAGGRLSMALTQEGRVLAWGFVDDQGTPVAVPEEARSGIRAIATGRSHALALTQAGRVIAWGEDSFGQASVPDQAGQDVTAIDGGANQTLAVRAGAAALPPAPLPSVLGGSGTACASTESYLAPDAGGWVQFAALGSPGRSVDGIPGAGAVDLRFDSIRVRLPAPDPVTITPADLGVPVQEGGGFGASVALANVNPVEGPAGDACIDLIVGMPGAYDGRGAVVVVPGTSTGFLPTGARMLPTAGLDLQPGDRLGAALAAIPTGLAPDFDVAPEPRPATIVVAGAPGHDAADAPDAGMLVTWLTGPSDAPLQVPDPIDVGTVVQGVDGVRGQAEPGDGFGEVLATDGTEWVAVGIPSEDIELAQDAGAVARLMFAEGRLQADDLLWQGGGLPGTSEPGDRLGAALVETGTFPGEPGGIHIGVPGKDADGQVDSGAVITFPPDPATGLRSDEAVVITQDSPDVPDRSEAGDAFGASLALLMGGRCRALEATTLAIGVPGEDDESTGRTDVGGITYLCDDRVGGEFDERVTAVQDVAAAAAGDAVGTRLVDVEPEPESDEAGLSGLLVGAPGRDAEGGADVGAYFMAGGARAPTWSDRSLQLAPLGGLGADPGERYGG